MNKVLQRLILQRPLPLLYIVVSTYVLISPMALLIPPDVFTQYPWTRAFTDSVAAWVPMIDRVVAYRHPHPDKLRFFLAYAWCCMPLIVLLMHRYQDAHNKPDRWGPGAFDFWLRWLGAWIFFGTIFFLLWYWPNFPGSNRELLGSITLPHDERRHFFWSTSALVFKTPLWLLAVAWLVDEFRCEVLNLLWRLGLISTYPSKPNKPTPVQQ